MNVRPLRIVLLTLALTLIGSEQVLAESHAKLDWQSLPDLPNEVGVPGPFVGVHHDVLIVAGGANFARPVWDSEKQWHDQIDVLQKTSSGYKWIDGGKLPRPMGYGATVSTPDGVVCMGGNDAGATFDAVFALQWDAKAEKVRIVDYPSLPRPCAYGQATLFLLMSGSEHGFGSAVQVAFDADKLRLANLQWQGTGSQVAFWVIVLGAAGHHLSSYTADQAVVQRYMTTSSEKLAARSIWTNAVLSIPATLLFFAIGTALFMFYQSHPERLDPTITTDQIFPLFIAREMPIGIAGLVVAGVFSAAQSTVSTSMNSMATTIVTDFLRPLGICTTDRQYLRAARLITFSVGVLGTVLGLFFIAPEITSLFDTFIKVVGLFMGVLGGLFLLGVLTRRASAYGAFTGAVVGALVMCWLFVYSSVNGYLYITIGMSTCIIVGYLVSCLVPSTRDLSGLTIFTLDPHPTPSRPTLT